MRALLAVLMVILAVAAVPAALPAAAAEHLSPADEAAAKVALKAVESGQWAAARTRTATVHDTLMRKALHWHLLRARGATVTFEEIAAFLKANPDWPGQRLLRRRGEEAMTQAIAPERVLDWFADAEPVITDGWVRYGEALRAAGRLDEAKAVIRRTWIDGTFGKRQEQTFLRHYRKFLTKDDHKARLDRLLWAGSYWPARRMMGLVDKDTRRLAEARLLLRHRKGNVDQAIAKVPATLKNDPGLLFERVRWRRRKGREAEARELMKDLPDGLPHPEIWWVERSLLARDALRQGHVTEAYRLVSRHGLAEGSAFADAEWMAGWIALRFLDEPVRAKDHFVRMFNAVNYPISRARGAYWAGRAAAAQGRSRLALQWYNKATLHPTTYYGQLATARQQRIARLRLAPRPAVDSETAERFEKHELTRVVQRLVQLDRHDLIGPFITGLSALDERPGWQSMAALLARDHDRADMAIRVAKKSSRTGFDLPHVGYPALVPPPQRLVNGSQAVEVPLVLAVIRQESQFLPTARSPAGARGLMQVLPSTARRVAQTLGIRYSKAKLTRDADYNMTLGQAYLGKLLDTFDGSYLLAIAAYNAGPSRAKRWIQENGDPRDTLVDAVDWVEMIPFAETRNYVQRVLENLQVYRARLTEQDVALNLEQDLKR
ncbi:MAG: lytic transglycosylase domain-containing protein [Rhodobacterales bacterium]|nr:lytic transglycosylase domain-containing protein [Rhodobacterales bacterium]